MNSTRQPARLLYLIRQIQLGIRNRLEDALRDFQLTVSQYTVLSILNHTDGLSSADLSRYIEITPQSMNELITSLERKQLVSRAEAPENRRILRISLTARGTAVIRDCEVRVSALEDELFQDLGAEQPAFRAQLVRILARLRGAGK